MTPQEEFDALLAAAEPETLELFAVYEPIEDAYRLATAVPTNGMADATNTAAMPWSVIVASTTAR